jgi:hypothetical protein
MDDLEKSAGVTPRVVIADDVGDRLEDGRRSGGLRMKRRSRGQNDDEDITPVQPGATLPIEYRTL